MMDSTNQVGLRAVKLVVASVDENPFGVQKGAHGTVAQDRAPLQAFYKVSRHSQQEYRSLPSFAAKWGEARLPSGGNSPFRSVIIAVFTREIDPRVPRGALSLKLGAITALVPAALILTSCSGNNSNPNKPVVSGVKPRAFVSNTVAGALQIVNAGKDSLVTTKAISAGSQPGLMALSADKRFTYVFDAGTNSIAVVNNSTEAQSASISLPGATESFVISPKGNRGFAAIPTATVLGQTAGVVQVMNLITNTATFVLDIPQARRVVINHSGSRVLVFSDSSDFFTVIDASLVGVPGAQPLTTINSNPGDRPVGAVFSDDDNTAYILNFGSECGGSTPGFT